MGTGLDHVSRSYRLPPVVVRVDDRGLHEEVDELPQGDVHLLVGEQSDALDTSTFRQFPEASLGEPLLLLLVAVAHRTLAGHAEVILQACTVYDLLVGYTFKRVHSNARR